MQLKSQQTFLLRHQETNSKINGDQVVRITKTILKNMKQAVITLHGIKMPHKAMVIGYFVIGERIG